MDEPMKFYPIPWTANDQAWLEAQQKFHQELITAYALSSADLGTLTMNTNRVHSLEYMRCVRGQRASRLS